MSSTVLTLLTSPCRLIFLASTIVTILTGATIFYWAKPHVDTLRAAPQKISDSLVVPSLAELEAMALGTHEQLEGKFKEWMSAHGKEYPSVAEYKKRLGNFATSAKTVFQHNSRMHGEGIVTDAKSQVKGTYYLGLTEFADMTETEFRQHFNLDSKVVGQECSATSKWAPASGVKSASPNSDDDLPDHVDWREKGIMSKVRNQGHCGSCWTFSTAGTLEAHVKKATGRNVIVAEQQLLDCAGSYDNHGCNGGLPSHAFQYILENGGIDLERAYPYEATQGQCRFRKWGVGAHVKGVVNITQFDENELHRAVALVGPVSVAFQVASDFRLYAGGVYSSTECKKGPLDVNHAVVASGLGVAADGTPYWIVKNSWGSNWGLDGYFLIRRGTNECGISDCASYPVL